MSKQHVGLPTLARGIEWLEELVAILSKPFLMVGFIISTLDLLTKGQLLQIALIYYGWALIQSVAVDATFFVAWHKAKKAALSHQWLQLIGYALLGLALGVVAWAAMDLQSLEQALGISNDAALARLNLNPVLLTHLRSLVAVIMGAVVAMISPEDSHSATDQSATLNTGWWHQIGQWKVFNWTRANAANVVANQVTTPPATPQIEHAQSVTTGHPEVVEIEQSAPVPNSQKSEQVVTLNSEQFISDWPVELDTEEVASSTVDTTPLQFHDYVLIEHMLAATVPEEVITHEETPAPVMPTEQAVRATQTTVKKNKNKVATKLHVVETGTPEQRIRAVIAEHSTSISDRQLARLAHCSPATAGKWKEVIKQEESAPMSVAGM